MRKTVMGTLGLMVIGALLVGGCDIKPEQVKVIAQNAGLFSAVGWIAMDDPGQQAIEAVKSILGTIEEKCADVEAGATYTEVVYPEVVKVIDSDKVKPQYRALCKAAAISLLGGLDMLFAANPEWKKDQDVAIQVVNAFILGAKEGLSLGEEGEVMKAARGIASKRAKVYSN